MSRSASGGAEKCAQHHFGEADAAGKALQSEAETRHDSAKLLTLMGVDGNKYYQWFTIIHNLDKDI